MTAATACRMCGTEPLDNAWFCHGCGSPLTESSTHAEYKQVTVLFADVVHSMAIAAAVGAERLREIMADLADRCAAVVQRYGGTVDKFTGDGIMASFQSASGAIDCAVDIQRALDSRHEANPDMPLRVRIGLNAGEPVAEGEDLFGTAVQLASRIAARAEPGQVLVSDVVRQLAAGKEFLFSDEGDVVLRGFEDPVRLYGVRS